MQLDSKAKCFLIPSSQKNCCTYFLGNSRLKNKKKQQKILIWDFFIYDSMDVIAKIFDSKYKNPNSVLQTEKSQYLWNVISKYIKYNIATREQFYIIFCIRCNMRNYNIYLELQILTDVISINDRSIVINQLSLLVFCVNIEEEIYLTTSFSIRFSPKLPLRRPLV